MSGKSRVYEFQPSLDNIPEESNNSLIDDSIDLNFLSEYAILTDDDLRKALYIDSSSSDEENETNIFASLHSSASLKNQSIIKKLSSKVEDDNVTEEHNDNIDINESDSVFENHVESNVDGATIAVDTQSVDPETGTFSDLSLQNNNDDLRDLVLSEVFANKLIDFNSPNGKLLFSQSIQKKYMNIFYCLSQYQRSNISDDSFSNCLEILLSIIKGKKYFLSPTIASYNNGKSFEDLLYYLHVENIPFESYVISKSSSQQTFRNAVQVSCLSSNVILVLCLHDPYANVNSLSLVGGFHKEKDMILLYDVVLSRLPSKWVKTSTIWNHMVDTFQRYQGYILVNIGQHGIISVTDDLYFKVNSNNSEIGKLLEWRKSFSEWLSLPVDTNDGKNDEKILEESFNQVKDLITHNLSSVPFDNSTTYSVPLMNAILNVFKGSKLYSQAIVFAASLNSEEKELLTNYFKYLSTSILTNAPRSIKKKSFRKLSSKKKQVLSSGGNNLALFLSSIVMFWDCHDIVNKKNNASVLVELQTQEKESMNGNVVEIAQFVMTILTRLLECKSSTSEDGQ